jgi:hypothetical protein
LKTRWEGPYKIIEIFNNGTFKIENLKNGMQLIVNGQRLKEYLHGKKIESFQSINLIELTLVCIK